MACQKPEPSDKLVLLNGRDDCHDCHFCVTWVLLQEAADSGATVIDKQQANVLDLHRGYFFTI